MLPELYVDFTFTSDEESLQDLDSVLGLKPKKCWNKGDPIERTILKYKVSGWSIGTEKERTQDLERHILAILERLLPKQEVISEVVKTRNLKTSLQCVIEMGDTTPSTFIDAPLVKRIADLGASIDFDIYL